MAKALLFRENTIVLPKREQTEREDYAVSVNLEKVNIF